jgi:D-sedoheptulose 7-phosphate isomerase
MLMLEQRIQQQFFDCADLQYQTAETLARPIAEAVQAVVGTITAGGKLIVAGQGPAEVLARHAAAAFVGRFERERPPLAALALTADAVLAGVASAAEAQAQQLRVLGQTGDVLLLLGGHAAESRGLVEAAHAQEITVLALVGRSGTEWRELLVETDVLIGVPHERAARILELQLLVLHCLCDAVDLQLMGEQDS